MKAIIFDFFGVLAPDVYPEWLQKHNLDQDERQNYFLGLAKDIDEGKIAKKEFLKILAVEAGSSPELVENELNDFTINNQLVDLLPLLAKKYQLALLCNADKSIIDPILEKHQLKKYFQVVIISSEVQLAKPQAEIYLLMLNRLDISPSEAIFVDDRAVNISGAEAVGITGIQYVNFEQLVASLAKEGIHFS